MDEQTIIVRAQEMLDSSEGWAQQPMWYDNAAKYYHMAEALVELLEVQHCGSIGGFGKLGATIQRSHGRYFRSLSGRLAWLRKVYPRK